MGGSEKSKGDDLSKLRALLSPETSKRTLLQRLVSKLAKTDTAARELEALAKAKGIEVLAKEAVRLGLMPEEDPELDPKSLASIFKSEYLGTPMPVIADPEMEPGKFKITSGPRHGKTATAKAMADAMGDALYGEKTYAPASFDGLEKAIFGIDKGSDKLGSFSVASTPYRETDKEFLLWLSRWKYGLITSERFADWIRIAAQNRRIEFHEWNVLTVMGLGSSVENLAITVEKQKEALSEAMEPHFKSLLDTWTEGLMTGTKYEALMDFKGFLMTALANSPLVSSNFEMRLLPTFEAEEELTLIYSPPGMPGHKLATRRRIDHYAIKGRRADLQLPLARLPAQSAKPTTPDKMDDDDFARAFQAWDREGDGD